jgi:hypothetical protein
LFTGLADTLRSEYLLYGIKVHMYLPAGILSPNFELENRTKPDITKKIEEGDTPMTPEACVECLIIGKLGFLNACPSHLLILSVQDWKEDTTRSQTTFSPISCESLPEATLRGTTYSGTGVFSGFLQYVLAPAVHEVCSPFVRLACQSGDGLSITKSGVIERCMLSG